MDTKYYTRITAQANFYMAVLKLNELGTRYEELLSGNRKKKFLSDDAFIDNVIEPLSIEFVEHLLYIDDFVATRLDDKHDIELIEGFNANLKRFKDILEYFAFEEDVKHPEKTGFISQIIDKAESARDKLK